VFRNAFRAVSCVAICALVVGWLVVPSGASNRTAAQGVTDDSIQIVGIVPDLDALSRRGIQLSGLSTQGFMDGWFRGYSNAFGPINGRGIEWITVGWDPIDTTSFDRVCTQAVQDNKPFLVMNSSGFRDSAIPCITVDNDTPYLSGDMMPGNLLKASGKNMLTLSLPPEVAGREAVRFLASTKTLPKTANVGIISSNIPGPKAAGDAIEQELKKRGYKTTKVELNGLASDPTALRREAGMAAGTFKAAGVDTVFNVQSFTQVAAFFEEAARANYKPQMYAVDGQAQTCTFNAAARLPAEATDVICVTTNDGKAGVDGKGMRADNPLEAECRANFEAQTKFKTTPNAPSGQTTVNGVRYDTDIDPYSCTLMNLLLPALKKAGKNPTWDKVYKNLISVEKGRAAYMSNGEGGFAKNKPYFANQVHMMRLSKVDANTPKAADGTYNGCPSPFTCWIPVEVNGQEWYPISGA
jgi:hypothetical protein